MISLTSIYHMQRNGMLLVGHGSKLPYNKELVESTGRIVQDRHPEYVVKCAFMNMNSPSIEETLAEFKKEKIDALVVVPLFLAKGVHILKDIPELIGLPEGTRKGEFTLNGKNNPHGICRPYRIRSPACRSHGKECPDALTLI